MTERGKVILLFLFSETTITTLTLPDKLKLVEFAIQFVIGLLTIVYLIKKIRK
jgi:hypothetical protein